MELEVNRKISTCNEKVGKTAVCEVVAMQIQYQIGEKWVWESQHVLLDGGDLYEIYLSQLC